MSITATDGLPGDAPTPIEFEPFFKVRRISRESTPDREYIYYHGSLANGFTPQAVLKSLNTMYAGHHTDYTFSVKPIPDEDGYQITATKDSPGLTLNSLP